MTTVAALGWPDAPPPEVRNPAPKAPVAQTPSPATGPAGAEPAAEPDGPRPVAPPSQGFGLTTYQDRDSGRIVVRVFDEKSGDVLLEFPPEGRDLAPYPSADPASPAPEQPLNAKARADITV